MVDAPVSLDIKVQTVTKVSGSAVIRKTLPVCYLHCSPFHGSCLILFILVILSLTCVTRTSTWTWFLFLPASVSFSVTSICSICLFFVSC